MFHPLCGAPSAPHSVESVTAAPAHPALVAPTVSTQWLADHLGSDRLLVLDASVLVVLGFDKRPAYLTGHEEYLVHGHVPGAVFADLLEAFSDPDGRFGFAKPSAEQFEQAAASVGVDNETTVVVYDGSVGQWAARLWWLFRSFGFDDVAVLDGGLTAWRAEGRSLEVGHVEPRTGGTFSAKPRPEVWADKDDVAAVVAGESEATLVCGVPTKEFSGETGLRPRTGHIPNSVSAPAGRLVDRDTNKFLPPDALRAVLGDAATSSAPVITYCAGGVAAAADALALSLIGRTDVRLYDGSLNEWAADESLPLESA